MAHAERRPGVVRRLAAGAPLEARVFRSLGEEVAERGVLVPQRLLQRHTRHLGQEGQFVGLLPPGERGVGFLVRGGLSLGVEVDKLGLLRGGRLDGDFLDTLWLLQRPAVEFYPG